MVLEETIDPTSRINGEPQYGTELVRQQVPVIVATDNLIKRTLFHEAIPMATFIDSPFNESAISEEVERELKGKPINYPAAISRKKVEDTRIALRESGFSDNAIIFGMDSVLLVPTKPGSNNLRIRNRGEEDELWLHDDVRKRDTMTLTAGVSAASMEGTIYTTQIYITVPVKPGLAQLDINYSDLNKIVDTTREAQIGVIKPNARPNSKIEYEMVQTGSIQTEDIGRIASFMSGAEAITLETLHEAAAYEMVIAPLIRESISRSPFNTFQHIGGHSEGSPLAAGGDCHHFTADLYQRIQATGIIPSEDIRIGLWDTDKPPLLRGHSNIIINGEHTRIVADSGITIPTTLPYSPHRPFHPSMTNAGKETFLANTDGLVSLVIRRQDKQKIAITPFADAIDITDFGDYLGVVTPNLVQARHAELRWELHNENGVKGRCFYLDSKGSVKIMDSGVKLYSFSVLEEPSRRQKERIIQELNEFGISFEELTDVYRRWRGVVSHELN